MALVSVIGANGVQGLAQIRQSLKAGHEVRGISRHRGKQLADFNDIDFRAADLFDEATLAPALEGSDYVFVNHPVYARRQRAAILASLGRASKEVGAKRLVWNTASWIPDRPGDPYTYGDNTQAVNDLFRTGQPATVFGSVLFMDNLLTGFAKPFIQSGRYVYPHKPDLRASWISLDDVAKIMLHAADRPDFEGSWMNIGGPETLVPQDVADALSKTLGKTIPFESYDFMAFGRSLAKDLGDVFSADQKEAFVKDIHDFYVHNNTSPTRPFEIDHAYMQKRLPDVKLETMAEFIARQDWAAPPTGTA